MSSQSGAAAWLKGFLQVFSDNRVVAAGFGALVAGLVGALSQSQKVYDFARKLVQAHIRPATAQPDTILVIVVCVLGGLTLLLVLAFGILLFDATKQRAVKNPRAVLLEQALNTLISNANKIVYQTLPPKASPPHAFEKVIVHVTVRANGDVTFERDDEVAAPGEPVHYWTQDIAGDAGARPVGFVEELSYSIEGRDNTNVAYLVLSNEAISKELAIFPLPRIEPNTASRKIRTSLKWPGFSRRLAETGEEDWFWDLASSRDVPLFELGVYYDRAIGKVSCENLGPKVKDTDLQPASRGDCEGWLYRVQNSPPIKHHLKFRKA